MIAANEAVKAGDTVRLKPSVKFVRCPEGRVDNKTATVDLASPDGCLRMKEDLRGCRHWNASDVEVLKSA